MDETRRTLISELENRFKPFTDALSQELEDWRFNFQEQKSAHLLHLDHALVVRHSLPYCISEETYSSSSDQDVKFFAAVVLPHSLALTRIDDYYDGGHKTKGGTLKVDGVDLFYMKCLIWCGLGDSIQTWVIAYRCDSEFANLATLLDLSDCLLSDPRVFDLNT